MEETWYLNLTDDRGQPINLTGYSALLQFRDGSGKQLLKPDCAISSAINGQIAITAGTLPQLFTYDLMLSKNGVLMPLALSSVAVAEDATIVFNTTITPGQVAGSIQMAGSGSLSFNAIADIEGYFCDMTITVSGTERASVPFFSDYLGLPFSYTYGGSSYQNIFTDGVVPL